MPIMANVGPKNEKVPPWIMGSRLPREDCWIRVQIPEVKKMVEHRCAEHGQVLLDSQQHRQRPFRLAADRVNNPMFLFFCVHSLPSSFQVVALEISPPFA